MNERTTVFVGCDLGDKFSSVCVLDEAGDVVRQFQVRSTSAAMSRGLRGIGPARFVIEVGTHSRWVDALARSLGFEVIVANPRRVRLISQQTVKTDRSDAELLARLGRADPKLLSPVIHRGPEAHGDLVRLRSRACLVRTRTLLINHVRGVVKSFGARIRKCEAEAFHHVAPEFIPAEVLPAVQPVLDQLASLHLTVKALDKWLERDACARFPETSRLMQVTGVGPVLALAYVLTIERPERFLRSRDVGPFLGLTCRKDQSGDRDPELRITKAGDSYLRALLVNAAAYILGPFGPDTDLRRWGLALAAHGKKAAKRKAQVAVARKLAVLLHRLWVSGEPYQPLRGGSVVAA